MSRWMEIKFKGTVKPEFREAFEKAITEGKWSASEDRFLTDFEENYGDNAILYLGISTGKFFWEWSASWWNSDGVIDMYDKETGVWQFKNNLNTHGHGTFYLDFEDEILPYLMESVEWYETCLKLFYEDDRKGTCLKKMELGSELKVVGWFDENGNYTAKQ